ncbi:hypothetical protein GCM10010317_071880 [Streptomyces mirabilis]|nr:hypothetical protein GCM10010317_071880 [Streptomyces mirabilis]
MVFAVVQVTTEDAFVPAAEAVCPAAWNPTSARAAATTMEEAAVRETKRVVLRMKGLLSLNIRKMIFQLLTVSVGLVLVVLRGVRVGAPEVRAVKAELSRADHRVRRGAVLGWPKPVPWGVPSAVPSGISGRWDARTGSELEKRDLPGKPNGMEYRWGRLRRLLISRRCCAS